ncbi:hypothetical protein [Streptomyces sp. IBSBF 2435]|uniref:hypothetical protein n=1 Tax=Streptomyces sp. IBSBF 2435 TaxID=2903531 RepID=UPI002FDC18C6
MLGPGPDRGPAADPGLGPAPDRSLSVVLKPDRAPSLVLGLDPARTLVRSLALALDLATDRDSALESAVLALTALQRLAAGGLDAARVRRDVSTRERARLPTAHAFRRPGPRPA